MHGVGVHGIVPGPSGRLYLGPPMLLNQVANPFPSANGGPLKAPVLGFWLVYHGGAVSVSGEVYELSSL